MHIAATARTPTIPLIAAMDTCVDDLARTLADRPCVPAGQRLVFEGATRTLVRSFKPKDGEQVIHACQAVLFNVMTTDTAHDICRGMTEAAAPRARSNLTAMGRLVLTHLNALSRLKRQAAKQMPILDEVAAEPEPLLPPEPREAVEQDVPIETQPVTETPTAIEAQSDASKTVQEPCRFPGRAKMLAARAARLPGRKQAQLANKLMDILHAAGASLEAPPQTQEV